MTNCDEAVGTLCGNTCAVESVVHERRNGVGIAYNLAVFHNGAVACSARDSLGVSKLGLGHLVHSCPRSALEAEVIHLGNLHCDVLTYVLVECNLYNVCVCKRRLQVVLEVTVTVNVESAEDCEALGQLEADKAKQVESSVGDSAMADCYVSCNSIGSCANLSEVQSLLAYLLNLTGNGELNVIGRVRPNLVARHARYGAEVARKLDACNLGVDEFVDGQGDCTTSVEVSVAVVVATCVTAYGVHQDSAGVAASLDALLQELTHDGILALMLTNLLQLLAACHSFSACAQSLTLTDEGFVFLSLCIGELTVLFLGCLFDYIHSVPDSELTLLDLFFGHLFH